MDGYMDNDILVLENDWSKIETSFNMNTLIYNQSLRDVEVKVFKESGTYDDLEVLYEAVDKKNKSAQKGIFVRIAEWFENFFKKVMDGIMAFLTGAKRKNPDELVEYDPTLDDINKDGKSILGKMGDVINKVGKTAFGGALWSFIKFVGPIFVRVYVARKVIKLARRAADAKITDVKGTWGKLQSGLSSLCKGFLGDDVEDKVNTDGMSLFGKLKTWIGNFGKRVLRFITGATRTAVLNGIENEVMDPSDTKKNPKETKTEPPKSTTPNVETK